MSKEIETETKATITLDDIKKFINSNDDGKKWLQGEKDSTVTKAINTYKTNFLEKEFPTLLETEVSKRLPVPETEEAKRLRELEKKFSQAEAATNLANLKSDLLKHASDKQIPNFLVDYSIDVDKDKSIEKLENLHKKYNENIAADIEKRYEASGRTAPVINQGIDDGTIDYNNIPTDAEFIIKNADSIQKFIDKGK